MKTNQQIEKKLIDNVINVKKEIKEEREYGAIGSEKSNKLKLELLQSNLELELFNVKNNYFNNKMISTETYKMLSYSLEDKLKQVKNIFL